MNDLIIREASLADAPRLLEIYSPYVTDTVITSMWIGTAGEGARGRRCTGSFLRG